MLRWLFRKGASSAADATTPGGGGSVAGGARRPPTPLDRRARLHEDTRVAIEDVETRLAALGFSHVHDVAYESFVHMIQCVWVSAEADVLGVLHLEFDERSFASAARNTWFEFTTPVAGPAGTDEAVSLDFMTIRSSRGVPVHEVEDERGRMVLVEDESKNLLVRFVERDCEFGDMLDEHRSGLAASPFRVAGLTPDRRLRQLVEQHARGEHHSGERAAARAGAQP